MKKIFENWGKIVGVTTGILLAFNVAVYYGMQIGFPLGSELLGEKWYYLALQFCVQFALGLVFPLLFPVFSFTLLYIQGRPISDLLLSVLKEKTGALSYLLVPASIFPTVLDGFIIQAFGLLLGMLIGRKFGFRRVMP